MGAAWALFIGVLLALLGVDYGLRMSHGDVKTGGLHDLVAIGLFMAGSAVALVLVWRSTTAMKGWARALIIVVCAAMGFILFAAIGLVYTVKTGIDSL